MHATNQQRLEYVNAVGLMLSRERQNKAHSPEGASGLQVVALTTGDSPYGPWAVQVAERLHDVANDLYHLEGQRGSIFQMLREATEQGTDVDEEDLAEMLSVVQRLTLPPRSLRS